MMVLLFFLERMHMYCSSFLSLVFSFAPLNTGPHPHLLRMYTFSLSLFLVFLACAYMYRFFTMTSLYIRRHSSTTTPLFHHADDERRGEEGED